MSSIPLNPYLNRLESLTEILEHSENKRQKILDFMKFAPCISSIKNIKTGRYEYVNRAFCVLVGKDEKEIVGKTTSELFSKENMEEYLSFDLEVIRNKKSVVFICNFKNKLHLVVKFLVVNGETSVGSIGLEIPTSFKLIKGE